MMTYPTAVNDQITDSITQVNTAVLGSAPGLTMGGLFQATGQAISNIASNGSTAQQNSNVTGQAATTTGVAMIYGIDVAAIGKGIKGN
jgi:hypothetical protein